MTAERTRKARWQYTKRRFIPLKRAVRVLGARAIDQRTSVAEALAAWRTELLADLAASRRSPCRSLALIEEAVKTKLILDSVVGTVPLRDLRVTAGWQGRQGG